MIEEILAGIQPKIVTGDACIQAGKPEIFENRNWVFCLGLPKIERSQSNQEIHPSTASGDSEGYWCI